LFLPFYTLLGAPARLAYSITVGAMLYGCCTNENRALVLVTKARLVYTPLARVLISPGPCHRTLARRGGFRLPPL
jgi:hypothetical protein